MVKPSEFLMTFTVFPSSTNSAESFPLQSCLSKLAVVNGDWERGVTSPWYVPAPKAEDPKVSVVSPGYKSNHALRLSVPKSNSTNFSFINPSIGKQCAGHFYHVQSALNWGNYTGPSSTDRFGCKITIQSSYCYGNVVGDQQIYALESSRGWRNHSFTCMAMKTGGATFTIDFSCSGNQTYEIPSFQLEMDNLEIYLIENSS